MASVLNSAPRTGHLDVDADALRYSAVCIECESTATQSIRRWSGTAAGFIPVRMCQGHAALVHVRAALLSTTGLVALITLCVGGLIGHVGLSLASLVVLVALVALAPRAMRSRLRRNRGQLAISGASVAFARNKRRGITDDRGEILDGWFTLESLFEDDLPDHEPSDNEPSDDAPRDDAALVTSQPADHATEIRLDHQVGGPESQSSSHDLPALEGRAATRAAVVTHGIPRQRRG